MSKITKSADLLKEILVLETNNEFPGNWINAKFNSVLKINSGKSLTKNKMNEAGNIPVFGGNGVTGTHDEANVNEETIVIGRVGFYCGSVHLTPEKAWVTDNAFIVNFSEQLFDKIYLYWFLKHLNLRQFSNSSAQPVISGKTLTPVNIKVPPLLEQRRIANKLENLLLKIDEAKRLIEEAKETFELRHAAILDKAFHGELTAKWREENGLQNNEPSKSNNEKEPYKLPIGWKWKKFKEIATVKSNLVEPLDYPELPLIAPDNIEKKTGRLLDYVSVEESRVKSHKHYFYKGQIIYSKIRPYLSKVIIADFDGLCSADMYPIESKLNINFLFWYMLSSFFVEKASTAGSRSVLPKINQKELGEIPVPVPSLEEQQLIVNIIRSTINKEDEILDTLDLDPNIENIQNSILQKAFQGELGTNNPNEESALELLKEILPEKAGR